MVCFGDENASAFTLAF